ncbi:MAG: PspC domain-containing protein [Acetobacterium sp.]
MKKHLMRDRKKGIFAGVCAGLGEYFNLSPWIFRALFIIPVLPFVLNFLSGVVSIVLYVVLALFIPDKKRIGESDVVEVDYEIIEDPEESENDEEPETAQDPEDSEGCHVHNKEKEER